ncbi:MAG: YitT family protein [Clostridiales bacterium]|nr:YitT family protein [Clostridiales bacterium]
MKHRLSSLTGKKQMVLSYIYIIVGSAIASIAYPVFLVENSIVPGGVTGIAIIINYLFSQFSVGSVSLVLNIPLFIVGYRSMGKVFAFRSLVATVIFSILIDVFTPVFPLLTNDLLLSAIFGGALLGIGLGLILKGGATTGGSDMIAKMIHSRFSFISIGMFLLAVDFFVATAAGIFVDGKMALYALICIYVTSKSIDLVLEGLNASKSCYIITQKHEEVSSRIMNELERGVTHIHATGAYTGESRPIILCVASIEEVPKIKNIVSQEDENAFMFINDTKEALGEGFKEFSA